MSAPFSWTHSGNYPAGGNPWNGQPIAVQPSQTYFVPNVKPPAQWFNFILGEIADDSSYLHTIAPPVGAAWRPAFTAADVNSGGGAQLYKPAWDAEDAVWLLPLAASGATVVAWSCGADDGAQWRPVATGAIGSADTTGIIDAAATVDPTAGVVWGASLQANNALLVIALATFGAGSWTTKASITTVGMVPLSVEMATIGSRIVVAVGGTSGSIIGLYSGSSTVSFAQVGSVAGTNHQGWALKSNGSLLIACPTIVQPTELWTSTDGITFAPRSLGTLLPGTATWTPIGLAWSAWSALWYLAIQVTGGTGASLGVAIFSSPDGGTWTETSSGFNQQAADLAAAGPSLILTTTDQTVLGVAGTSTMFVSEDAGATWTATTPAAQGNISSGSVGYTRARVQGSGNQFLVANSAQARFSTLGRAT